MKCESRELNLIKIPNVYTDLTDIFSLGPLKVGILDLRKCCIFK